MILRNGKDAKPDPRAGEMVYAESQRITASAASHVGINAAISNVKKHGKACSSRSERPALEADRSK